MRFHERCRVALMGVLLSTSLLAENAAAQDINALKAAYVYYFSKFISWQDTERGQLAAVTLCFVANDEALARQFNSLSGKAIGDKKLAINELAAIDDELSLCNVLYLETDVELPAQRGLLVVTAGQGLGGDIKFVVAGSKLSFEIENQQIKNKSLKVSSRLLRLAAKVNR